jgi:hypothetical protein
MDPYDELYLELRMSGESEEDAAELTDLAICADFERSRLEREPTHEEVSETYQALRGDVS